MPILQRFTSVACIARLHKKCDWGITCFCECHGKRK